MTAAEFKAMTALAGKVLERNFPRFTFVLILSDESWENMASNAQSKEEILDLIARAITLVSDQTTPPVVPEVKA